MLIDNTGSATDRRPSPWPCRPDRLRIVVTGGAGFLGSHLCTALLAAGHRVTCVDNMLTGRMSNIDHLLANPNFRFVEHDIIDPLRMDEPLDQIFNLACPASPPIYQRDPIHTLKTCVIGSLNMLELARDKSARILQASTSEVYGNPDVSPQSEAYFGNVNPVGPRSCYDEGKRAAETLFHDYAERQGTDVRIARIFNTYGPRMRPDDGRVVSNFIVSALLDQPLTLNGNGHQTRSFCYVDDLVDGLIGLMQSSGGHGMPVNLGNPDEISVIALARMVLDRLGGRGEMQFSALPQDDPMRRKPDISRARRLLGWAPTVPLSEGLGRTIAYFQDEVAFTELDACVKVGQ